MKLDKNNNVYYKNTLKQMISYVTKYGIGESCLVYLYNYIDKETNFVHPVIILNQESNPWSDIFYPVNLFIVGKNLTDIDIFNSDANNKYHISTSVLIDVKSVRELLKDKTIEIEFNIIDDNYISNNIPFSSSTIDRNIGYVDKFKNIRSLNNIFPIDDNKFITIPENTLNVIHSEVVQNTSTTVKLEKNRSELKIFYSIIPFLADKIEYLRYLHVSDNEVTSTVYLRLYIKSITIHNFYKYVDLWNIINTR